LDRDYVGAVGILAGSRAPKLLVWLEILVVGCSLVAVLVDQRASSDSPTFNPPRGGHRTARFIDD